MRNRDPTQQSGWLAVQLARGVMMLSRLPRWAFPPIAGAALVFLITLLRDAFLLLVRPLDPRALLAVLLALIVAPASGAVAGFAYLAIARPLRRLKAFGDLLTGAILGSVYMFAILVPAKYLFGDDSLKTGQDWLTATFFGVGLGILVSVVYWYNMWRVRREGQSR